MNNITVNAANNTIELSKKFAKAASRYGTEEYRMLQEVRRDYPGFEVVEATKKAKAAKDPYKKLNFEFMEKYIKAHDNEEKSIMKQYLDLRGMSPEAIENGAASKSLPEVRKWFLNKYPQIKAYHEKREQELEKLKTEKEAERAAEEEKAFQEYINSLLAA